MLASLLDLSFAIHPSRKDGLDDGNTIWTADHSSSTNGLTKAIAGRCQIDNEPSFPRVDIDGVPNDASHVYVEVAWWQRLTINHSGNRPQTRKCRFRRLSCGNLRYSPLSLWGRRRKHPHALNSFLRC